MLKNHLTITLRRLLRRPGSATLHVFGLGLGLAACAVVLLYATHELTYDRFHERADHIYQVRREVQFGEHTFHVNGLPLEDVARLQEQVPGLERVVQTQAQEGVLRVPETGVQFEEKEVLFATSNLFEVFTFPLVRGNPTTVLDAPDGAVVTPALARKLFGEADPIGQTLTYERGGLGADSTRTTFHVTGVVAAPPGNSTIQFALVLPVPDPADSSTVVFMNQPAYALLTSPSDTSALITVLEQESSEHLSDFEAQQHVHAVPFTALHLSGRDGGRQTLYLFGTMALFVLVIACINYTNLATAQAAGRGREVGVRKTLGASRASLRGQFLAESTLLALAGGVLALALTLLARPAFNRFLGIELAATPLSEPWVVAAMLGLSLLTGLAAGTYPAFVLARKRPVQVLKGLHAGRERGLMRRALVVVQFALAIGMIAATLVVEKQLRYGQDTGLGFAGDQIVMLDLSAPALQKQSVALRDAVRQVPGVKASVRTSAAPGGAFVGISGHREGEKSEEASGIITSILTAEPGYSALFGLQMLAGRALRESEHRSGVVLNETAARAYGLMTDDPHVAIGQKIELMGTRDVVGVVEDFIFTSVRTPIGPLAITVPNPDAEVSSGFVHVGGLRMLAVEIDAGRVREALTGIDKAWQSVVAEYPFAYAFVDEAFADALQAEQRVRAVFGAAALLAALLACLGLFGLAAFAAEQRTKEIGVRKVLGAGVGRIVVLLTRDFALLVAVSFAIAAPVTYWLMQRWLERFAYRVDVEVTTLLLVGSAVLVLALATVAYHAVRAATANPVHALRSE